MELPELRKGEFWRVSVRENYRPYYHDNRKDLMIQIRERGFLGIGSKPIFYEYCKKDEEDILHVAKSLIKERDDHEAEKSLLGDFNKKKVNARWRN